MSVIVRNYAEHFANITEHGRTERAVVRWSPLSLGWQRAHAEPEPGSPEAGLSLVWRDLPEDAVVSGLELAGHEVVRAFLIGERVRFLLSLLPPEFRDMPEGVLHAATLEADDGNAHGVMLRRVGSVVQVRRLVIEWEDIPADCLGILTLQGRV